MKIEISMPFGGKDASFNAVDLVAYIRNSGRNYIIQGQTHRALVDHKKPNSLDYWLRANFTNLEDTCQAVNEVLDALLKTGLFAFDRELRCPDSNRLCKGIRLKRK